MSDLNGTIAGLYVYPIKSCAGIRLEKSLLTESGLAFDRAFMLVDAEGRFVTQRELPRMVLIQPQLTATHLLVDAPGMSTRHIPLTDQGRPIRVQVWSDTVKAFDFSEHAASWFSDFLEHDVRLVRFDTRQRRLSSLQWTAGIEAPNQFSDGYPLLVVSAASLTLLNERLVAEDRLPVGIERFRPNIVLDGFDAHDEDWIDVLSIPTRGGDIRIKPAKPCSRCPIPNIDPASGVSNSIVLDELLRYRGDARVNGAITFGMQAIVLAGREGLELRTGQRCVADYRFD